MSGQMIPYFRCWLCWGVINPKGSVFNLDLYSLFLVNKELLSHPVTLFSLLLQPRPGRELLLAHEGDRMNINKNTIGDGGSTAL